MLHNAWVIDTSSSSTTTLPSLLGRRLGRLLLFLWWSLPLYSHLLHNRMVSASHTRRRVQPPTRSPSSSVWRHTGWRCRPALLNSGGFQPRFCYPRRFRRFHPSGPSKKPLKLNDTHDEAPPCAQLHLTRSRGRPTAPSPHLWKAPESAGGNGRQQRREGRGGAGGGGLPATSRSRLRLRPLPQPPAEVAARSGRRATFASPSAVRMRPEPAPAPARPGVPYVPELRLTPFRRDREGEGEGEKARRPASRNRPR